ncbi:MAG: SUMF1/EgtB/PvdO family nonheme iron enzyme [bacterium]|nr:SUMF1/EgtB/PvdO family nonheme iron enzyme [bacterium]
MLLSLCLACSALAIGQSDAMIALDSGSLQREDGAAVHVSGFSISAFELTKGEYDRVRAWAVNQGYDMAPGIGHDESYPVSNISWYDAVKFCNAVSELAGRTPVYYTQASRQSVYRAGRVDPSNACVHWNASGYRLPTEAEWEFACRAGTTSLYYWGDITIPSEENEYAWHTFWRALDDNVSPHPVGLKKPNPYGLCDMSGNVAEWCWDRWQAPYDPDALRDPRGPDIGLWRTLRGGSVALDNLVESGFRSFVYPFYRMFDIGMRVASSDPACPAISDVVSDRPWVKPAPPVLPPNDGPEPAAHRLFALLNPDAPELADALTLYEEGKYPEALAAYRDLFVAQQRSIPLRSMYRKDGFGDRKDITWHMSLKGQLDWYRTPDRPDNDVNTGLILHEAAALLKEWDTTGDKAPLRQWFFIMDSFARYARHDYDTLGNEGRAIKNQYYVPQSWDFGMGFTSFPHRVRDLRKIVHALPEDGADDIPPVELANLLSFIATDLISMQIKDGRHSVPNQLFYVSKILLNMGDKLREFRDAPAWYDLGQRRFENGVLHGTMMHDGGDLEQSLNYNDGLTTEIIELEDTFGDDIPDWVTNLRRAGTKRMRFFAGLQQPFGQVPATGSAYTVYPPDVFRDPEALAALKKRELARVTENLKNWPDPDVERIYNHLFGPGTQEAPEFTSAAFPFSGFYMMRDGWDAMSRYLWLMGARPGQGHACENINAVDVIAFGRHMLIAGGADSYSNPEWIPEDQRPIIEQLDLYRGQSFSRNTVVVDGHSQRRLIFGDTLVRVPYDTPIPCRWLASPTFDFAEAHYDDGYGNTADTDIRASHARQVIFVREAGIWIVTDLVTADAPRTYTACWNFPPEDFETRSWRAAGFGEMEVAFDAGQRTIATSDPDAPNLFIHQFCASPLSYEKHFGALDPARGWLAPGISGRRYPKVDIHSSWEGPAGASILVSALVPSPTPTSPVVKTEDLSDRATVGFRMTLADGTVVEYAAAPEATPLALDGLEATAAALLSVRGPAGRRGLVLDTANLRIDGHPHKTPTPSVCFAFEQEGIWFRPIRIPETFYWVKGRGPGYEWLR